MRCYENEESVVIEVPNVRSNTGAVNRIKTFSEIVGSNPQKVIADVPDMNKFSASLGWREVAPKQELYIKNPGGHVVLPSELQQFSQAISCVLEDRGGETIADEFIVMGVLQSRIDPRSDTDRPFYDAHKDLFLKRLHQGDVSVSEIYVVSDCLTTGFTSQALTLEEQEAIQNVADPDKEMSSILNGWDYASERPGVITKHDTTTAHALANPEQAMCRTALILNFTLDATVSVSNMTSPGLPYFSHEAWETRMKNEFSVLELLKHI